jgi:hypothetical protein
MIIRQLPRSLIATTDAASAIADDYDANKVRGFKMECRIKSMYCT